MKSLAGIILTSVLAVTLSGCRTASVQRDDWAPDVKEAINDFLTLYKGESNTYAVFDFDNTSSIFDIEDQLMVYQLESMSYAIAPDKLKSIISTDILEAYDSASFWIDDICAAYDVLYSRYGPFSPAGLSEEQEAIVHSDPYWLEFAAKTAGLLERNDNVLKQKDDHYCWILYWFSGMTESELYDLAYRSHTKYSGVETSITLWKSPSEINSRLGQVSVEVTRGISVTENIKELWAALNAAGIDVWVCSASGLQQVAAAVDAFGLHDCCSGVMAMTIAKDAEGRYTPGYDFGGRALLAAKDGWREGLPIGTMTAGTGKVAAINNVVAPLYGGNGPIAGFMDSTGDFNFCTEFASLRMVVCFNRASRPVTDGGGLIAEIAIHQRDNLGLDVRKAGAASDTMYLLQGRDENGMRSFRPSNRTVRYGESVEKLFDGPENEAQLEEMKTLGLSTAEAIGRYSPAILKEYAGYHSR